MARLVDVPPQRVFGKVPLTIPLIKMSEAEDTWLQGQPQIYTKDYPLDFDGLNFSPPWWADTGVGGGLSGASHVGGGNVRMLPGESTFGLGATAAQVRQQQAAEIRRAAAAKAQAERQAKAAAAKTARDAKIVTAKAEQAARRNRAVDPQAAVVTKVDRRIQACTTKGGTWDTAKLSCTLPISAQRQTAAARSACQKQGGIWDALTNACGPNSQQTACTTKGGAWSNGVCGGLPITPICPTAPTSCGTGMIIGKDANGCTACVADPNYSVRCPVMDPCPSGQGRSLDASGCYSSPCSPIAPISCPAGYQLNDGDIGFGGQCVPIPGISNPQPQMNWGGGGGGAPMPSAGYDPGAGMPMGQGMGPGPQMTDQAFAVQQGPASQTEEPYRDKTPEESDEEKKDDTSEVAETNIFESIAKLFTGMGGLQAGMEAPPPWFGLGKGGNAPVAPPKFFTVAQADPVKPSTIVAVVGGAVTLMVGAAAMYLWTRGQKR